MHLPLTRYCVGSYHFFVGRNFVQLAVVVAVVSLLLFLDSLDGQFWDVILRAITEAHNK